jgi:cell division protein ZipA
MEYNFRTALIVISAVVITAIFVHGFWTIRKNKNPYKLKAKSKAETPETQNRGFDGSGFDQDGVS